MGAWFKMRKIATKKVIIEEEKINWIAMMLSFLFLVGLFSALFGGVLVLVANVSFWQKVLVVSILTSVPAIIIIADAYDSGTFKETIKKEVKIIEKRA